MAKSSAERQRALRARMAEDGFVTVTVVVREHQAAELRLMAQALMVEPDLEFGPFRNTRTGQLVRKPI